MYGVVEKNEAGLIKCEICGEYFNRVACHVNKAHGLSAKEYKVKFGFVRSVGLCSDVSKSITSENSKEFYRNGVFEKFISRSHIGKFKKGCSGRTSDIISPQARIQQTNRMRSYVQSVANNKQKHNV